MAMKSEMGKKSRAAKPLTTKSFVAATPVVASARTLGPRAFSIAINKRKSIPERLSAFAQVPLLVEGDGDRLEAILEILRNVDEPLEVRVGALKLLQSASFSVLTFEPTRSAYQAALRQVAQDENEELRVRAIGLLAQQKDGFAQKKLLEGLQDPSKALVPPEKALQLLGYDVHAAGFRAARTILENPPNPVAKQEALRLLAADPTAVPIFEETLLNKDEFRENRQISASALHSLAPDKMRDLARNIVLDKADYDDIRATSLTALSQFGDSSKLADDKVLQKSVDRMRAQGSTMLQQGAVRFLSKNAK